MKTTQNQVRQILMNELGLTRESIREEVEKIVEKTVDSFIQSDKFQISLERAIQKAFKTRYRYSSGEEEIKQAIQSEVKQIVKIVAEKFVGQNFKINVERISENGNGSVSPESV
jgi:hypothetical protein